MAEALARPGNGNGPPRDDARFPLRLPETTPPVMPMLTCAPARVDLGDGVLRGVLAYNGQLPGPTWVARRRDRVSVALYNNLGEPTITHWHGLLVDTANDGGPHTAIGSGQTYSYDFPIV